MPLLWAHLMPFESLDVTSSGVGAYTVLKPAERVSRLSTSEGYSHPSGPQLQAIQVVRVSKTS